MTEKLRRTWRHLAFRTRLLLVAALLCGVTVTVALALDCAKDRIMSEVRG